VPLDFLPFRAEVKITASQEWISDSEPKSSPEKLRENERPCQAGPLQELPFLDREKLLS
jgi:hypothetical protein